MDLLYGYICHIYMEKQGQFDLWNQSIDIALSLIKDPFLRFFILYRIWIAFVSPKVKLIVEVVDKARKAPRDKMCVQSFGMTVEDTLSMLSFSKKVVLALQKLHEQLPSEMTIQGYHEYLQNKLSNITEFALEEMDDLYGDLIQFASLQPKHWTLNSQSLSRHLILIRVTEIIYLHDLRLIRPLKLVTNSFSVGNILFSENAIIENAKDLG